MMIFSLVVMIGLEKMLHNICISAVAMSLRWASHGLWASCLIFKSTQCFLLSFKSIGLSVQEKKRKIDFQDGHHGGHVGFLIRMILAIFYSTSHPDASNQVSDQLAFLVQEKKGKIDFQDGCHGGQLRFPIGMILAIFDLQVTPLLPSKFLINWHSIMLTPITWILLMFLAVCGKERSWFWKEKILALKFML